MVLTVVIALTMAGLATAAPDEGAGSGDIEMDDDAGSGSATPADGSDATAPDTATGSATGSGSDSQVPAEPAIVKDPKVARKWLNAARVLVSKGDYYTNHKRPDDAKPQYDNAITAYQKAIEAGDDLTVYYSLALVEDKLGHEADAYHHVKRVVTADPPVNPNVQKKAQALLDEITGKVGVVRLTVEPEGATISIAGTSYGEAPLAQAIVLMPGTYTVSFALPGYQPKETDLKIEAGVEAEKKIDLDPVPIKVQPHVFEPEPEPPPVVAKPSKLPLWAGVTATGLFTVGAVIFGGSAISQHHAYTDPTFTKQERADAQSLGRTMSHLCDASIGVAVLSAAFTVYWYEFKYKKELDVPPTGFQGREVPKVDMLPWVQPGAGGIAAVGSF